MNVIFRAQHGDVGPWDVREEDVSYQAWQEHVFERWPNSGCQGTPAEREGEHDGGEEELDGRSCRPSVSPAGVETKDDIKFIWNGRVLSTTEELREVCARYFGKEGNASSLARGTVGDGNPVAGAPPANKVLILHAVVRPPIAPMKRKGKKGVEGAVGGSQGRGQQEGDGVCSCCVVS